MLLTPYIPSSSMSSETKSFLQSQPNKSLTTDPTNHTVLFAKTLYHVHPLKSLAAPDTNSVNHLFLSLAVPPTPPPSPSILLRHLHNSIHLAHILVGPQCSGRFSRADRLEQESRSYEANPIEQDWEDPYCWHIVPHS